MSEAYKLLLGQLAVNRIGDGAVDAAADEMGTMLRPLLTLIDQAQSLEEIGEALYDLYPRLDGARFQELLARAMLASGLTGHATSGRQR
jgi:phage gp29-like protein